MTRWYSTYHHILIFGTIMFLNDKSSTFALKIVTDKQAIEYSLHAFMIEKYAKNFSMKNLSKLGKRVLRQFSICGLSVSQKLNLCKIAMVEEDEFEEEFETYVCNPEKFQYTFTFEDVEKHPQISMYQCPKLLRWHPNTGALIADTRQLFISRMSLDTKQAMVYSREREGDVLRPLRHVLDITKKDLKRAPPVSKEIRSQIRFPVTPVRSVRNSPSPTRSRPQFMTSPNSPSQISSSKVSPRMSPAHSSIANQSPSRNILSGITPSMFLGPMVRIPQNVGTGTSREKKTSTTPTPIGSPLHSKSGPATPASGSGTATPYFSPSLLSPVHPSVGVETSTRPRRRAPPGIILRGTNDPSRPSTASVSGESTDDSSLVTDLAKQRDLGSSHFTGPTSIEENVGTGKRKAGTNAGKRTGNIGTNKREPVKDHEWEAISAGSSIPAGHSKQMYKHKSFNRDRAYHSASNSPPNEGAGFPGFRTPVPKGTSIANMLGDLPSPGSAIHRTQSDNVSSTHDDSNISYPRWPTYRQGSTEVSKEGPKGNFEDTFSSHPPPYKNKDSISQNNIIAEWKQFQQQRKMKSEGNKKYTGEVFAGEEEDKAEEDISEASALNEVNFSSAYNKNLERHHTDQPTVLSTALSEDYSEHSLHRLFEQESLKESDTDMADTLASGSFSATKDLSAQVDLPDKKDSSIQTDFPGDIAMPVEADEPEEDTFSDVLLTATTDPDGEVFEEGTTMLSQSSTKLSDIYIGNYELVQAAPPGTKDESASQKNEDQPPSKDSDITMSESSVPPPSEPPRSSQPSSDHSSRKKD